MGAIFKFNSSNGALLCSKCRAKIKTGKDYSEEELSASRGEIKLPPQYCNDCNVNKQKV